MDIDISPEQTFAISLDFWGTIAMYNPVYRRELVQHFARILDVSELEAETRYKTVKDLCDLEAHDGSAVTPLIAVKRVIAEDSVCPEQTVYDLEMLVRKNPPILDPEFPKLLDRLLDRGHIVGVSSNTNYISGSLVQSIFNLPWSFEAYSEELGVSKPHAKFFESVLHKIGECPGWFSKSRYFHFGDNAAYDGGSASSGIDYIPVSGTPDTVQKLYQFV